MLYFNTSHVSVQVVSPDLEVTARENFNTSHVSVQEILEEIL